MKAERGEAAAEEKPKAGRGVSGGSGKGALSTAHKCRAKRQAGRKAQRPERMRGPHDTHPFGGDTTAFSRKMPAGPSEPERRSPCLGLTPSSGADAAVTWTGSRGSVTVPKTRGPPRTVGGLLCLRSVNVRRSPSVSSTVTEQGMLAAEFCSARDPFQYGAAPWWCTRSHPRALTETDGMRVVLVPAATPAILQPVPQAATSAFESSI